ncbi:MAG: class I SAM-dependent methyltransferase [Candidatus Gribaldobacteria bacterium]|nr:class I SAM-dependent methyltransferase [Candidatus Gribaldobacteria bacterium]
MAQDVAWENEYKNPQLLTKGDKPQNDVLRFFKFLKKEAGLTLENLKVLDLGCGTGRNANYLAGLGNQVVGLEMSPTALELAKARAVEAGVTVDYQLGDIGSVYPFSDAFFDLVLDITSSNSLNEKERTVYLSEVSRVLKLGGYFLVRALCKEGDKNAKALLEKSPSGEKDTYFNPDMGLKERVFTREDLINFYSQKFKILKLLKKTSYTKFKNQSYKRNFWLVYLQKT